MADWTDAILNRVKPVEKLDITPPAPKFQGPIYGAAAAKNIPGLVAPGNTDLSALPIVRNQQGFGATPGHPTYSTVHSIGFSDENRKSPYYGKEVLARGIVDNKTTDDADAVRNEYYRTGKHLGIFANPEASDLYGQKLHSDWAAGYIPGVKMGTDTEEPKNIFGKVPLK